MFINITFISFSAFFAGALLCFHNNISDTIVLRIGKVSITEYELEKNLDLYISDFSRQYAHKPAVADITSWINSFTDRTYFLADAYEKGYDTLNSVNKWVSSMERYVVAKPDGLLFDKIDSPIVKNSTTYQLQLERRQEMYLKFYNEVQRKAKITIDPTTITLVEKILKRGAGRSLDTLNQLFSYPLFYYLKNDSLQKVTTGDFLNYYNTLPLRKPIVDMEGVYYYVRSFVYDEYALEAASTLGITSTLQFQLDKRNYRNNVIWAAYEVNELKKNITVSNEEIVRKYEIIKDRFFQPAEVCVTVYSYDDKRTAIDAMIRRKTGTQPLYQHAKIHYNDHFLSDSIRTAVFAMKDTGALMPVPFNGKYVLIVKESAEGTRMQTISEVQKEIIKIISDEKLIQLKNTRLVQLRRSHPINNAINYQKYAAKSSS